jgi:hypothetical protein
LYYRSVNCFGRGDFAMNIDVLLSIVQEASKVIMCFVTDTILFEFTHNYGCEHCKTEEVHPI